MERIVKEIREKSAVLGERAIILVTVGNHYHGFDRLIKKMDEFAASCPEKIIMQIGSTKYKPRNCEYFDFTEYERIQELNKQARIIVCHAGVGSILTALELNKPIIIVPRLKKFNEVFDDHQLEIAEVLNDQSHIKVVYDENMLKDALLSDFSLTNKHRTNDLVKQLDRYLSN